VIGAAAARVATGVRPLSDQHASGPFRLHLAEVLARRALTRAIERAAPGEHRSTLGAPPGRGRDNSKRGSA
jgi:hypothetical protein